jgi:hypothetical protein
MTATTERYLGIDVHKHKAQVAVLADEGEVTEGARCQLGPRQITQKYAGNRAFDEGDSTNLFLIPYRC